MALPKLLILASASPRRRELLREVIPDFQVIPSDAPEVHDEQLTARETCLINAYRKARSVAKQFPDALVIGADTLVYLNHTLYGKPTDLQHAHVMLQQLQGETHQVVTGICLIELRAHRQRLLAETTLVTFKKLKAEQIERYLASINPLDKAGAYAIQEHGGSIIAEIAGSYANVVGLPIERLRIELDTW